MLEVRAAAAFEPQLAAEPRMNPAAQYERKSFWAARLQRKNAATI
jgi:hypothetical protein